MLVFGSNDSTVPGDGHPRFERVGRRGTSLVAAGRHVAAAWAPILEAAQAAPTLEGVVLLEAPPEDWTVLEATAQRALARGGCGPVTFPGRTSTTRCVLVPADRLGTLGTISGATYDEATREVAQALPVASEPTPGLRLVGASMVKNECDVIEHFVRHNLRFLDALYVVDNGSTDGTVAILEALEAEGLPLAHRVMPTICLEQVRLMTDCVRWAVSQSQADWVFPLDADEFLVEDSPGDLQRALSGGGLVRTLPWRGFVPMSEDAMDSPAEGFRAREVEPRQVYKVAFRSEAFDDCTLAFGNHWLLDASSCEISGDVAAGLRLAHLPIRSTRQLVDKVLLGSARARLLPELHVGEAPHWLELAAEVRESGGWLPFAVVQEMALTYAADPGAPQVGLDPDPHALPELPACRYQSLRDLRNPLAYDAVIQDCLKLITGFRAEALLGSGAAVPAG